MWLRALDMHTLHIEHAALLGVFTVLMTGNALVHRGERGARWFPVYTFAAFSGAILIALRGRIPDLLSIVAGCLLFSMAYIFLHLSLAEFFGKRGAWKVQLMFAACAAAALLRWEWVEPNTAYRVGVYSALLALQLGWTALMVVRNMARMADPIRWAGSMMAGVLALLSVNNVVRAAGLGLRGAPADYLQGGSHLSWTLLVTSVLQGAAAIAFVWMTAARLQEELRVEATTDPLTRLLNRRAIGVWAEREIALSHHHGWPLAAILIDLDEFKSINDVWGHHCGDTVLLEVSRALSERMRPGDQLARIGGDEFVVLLPRTPEQAARRLAESLRGELARVECMAEGTTVRVRASFGVAEMEEDSTSWEELVQRCDQALYAVKAMGGDRTMVR